jgi:hypothetical protein
MTTDHKAYHQHLEERLAKFGREQPGPMSGCARLRKKAVEDGALSSMTKERWRWRSASPCAAKAASRIMLTMRHRLHRPRHVEQRLAPLYRRSPRRDEHGVLRVGVYPGGWIR